MKKKSKKPVARFCDDCGYELAADSDGNCPMCPRFEQLRMDFTVPRPSELAGLAMHGPKSLDADLPAGSAERRPTAAVYRGIIAAHRARSGSTGESAGTVIGKRGLRQPRAAPKERTAPPPDNSTGQPAEETAHSVAADPRGHRALPTPVARPTRQAPAVRDGARSSSFTLMSSETALKVAIVVLSGFFGALVPLVLASRP